MVINKTLLVVLVICFSFACKKTDSETRTDNNKIYDLSNAQDNLNAFVKVRASMNEDEEVIYYANGKIYGFVDGERDKPLLGYEMYNIGRALKVDGGYNLLTNEVLLYTDLETGEVLETFKNPYTDKEVNVLHVWNSPVNQEFRLKGKYGKWGVSHNKYGDDRICMNADVFLAYPSPLKVADYPENSQSDLYEAVELFQFFFSESDLNNSDKLSTDVDISWTRIGPWLPWMEMGQRPGKVVYQGAGYKLLEKDYNDMPAVLRDYVMANKPEYRHAPTEYSAPNETSWTYYKKMNPKK